jgi:glutamate 5-kinase
MSNVIRPHLSNLPFIFKIGTSGISIEKGNPGEGQPDKSVISSIATQLGVLKKEGRPLLLVSSGAVGFGKARCKALCEARGEEFVARSFPKAKTETGRRQYYSSVGQAYLIECYGDALISLGMLAQQIVLTATDFPLNSYVKSLLHDSMHDPNVLTIVNANDAVAVEELMISDNDNLAERLVWDLNASHLYILSNVSGVYKSMDNRKVIPVYNFFDETSFPDNTEGKSDSGIGGVDSKINVAKRLTWTRGTCMCLLPSRYPFGILEALHGKKIGTHFTCG